jgi:hypothetical protein
MSGLSFESPGSRNFLRNAIVMGLIENVLSGGEFNAKIG